MPSHRILIVDDNRDIRQLLQVWLATLGAGLEVLAMPSGEEALLEASRKPIGLLITDVRLAGMSGLELFEKIRMRWPDTKVILITGLSDPEIRQQVANAGASAFFVKPLDMADFLDAVERALGLVRSILTDQPIAIQPPTPTLNLGGCLTELRQKLSAVAVMLLTDQGQLLACSGDLPSHTDDNTVITSLMAAFNTCSKALSWLGSRTPENLLYLKGKPYNLSLSPVGSSHVLLTVTGSSENDASIKAICDQVLLTTQELSSILQASSMPAQPSTEAAALMVSPETQGAELEEKPSEEEITQVEAILHQTPDPLDQADLDNFWERLIEQAEFMNGGNASDLSYEEAQRLGLAPKEYPAK